MPITVSLVEESRARRRSLVALLARSPRLRFLGDYGTGEEALQGIPLERPDVVLVDVNLPGMNGIECVAHLKTSLPKLRVLMFTRVQAGNLIVAAFRSGANGYVLKHATANELIEAIEMVYAGGAPMSLPVAREVVDHFQRDRRPVSDLKKLAPWEVEILDSLSRNCRHGEIRELLDTVHLARARSTPKTLRLRETPQPASRPRAGGLAQG